MKYNRFEELPVWQAAIELAVKIFQLTAQPQMRGYYGLKDQLERAGVSISNNIAEGFERGTTNETITFLYISKGSSGEVRSLSHLMERMAKFPNLGSEILDIRVRAESVSRQLRGWLNSLQNTEIKGHRYLTEKSRKVDRAKRDRDEFLKELEEIRRRR